MKLKKTTTAIAILLTAVLIHSGIIQAEAADSPPPVSPALAVIAEGINMQKCGLKNTPLRFGNRDFSDFMSVDRLDSVTVTALPSVHEGILCLGDVPVIAGQVIKAADVSKLCFIPASAEVEKAVFRFSGEAVCCESSVKCTLNLFDEINAPPTVADNHVPQAISTVKNVMIYTSVTATDPEGDGLVYTVSAHPKHGTVAVTDQNRGVLSYTPAYGYMGDDAFTVTVSDAYGNVGDSKTFTVNVNKSGDTFFFDMLRRDEHLNAVLASGYGIMSGKLVDGKMCFLPDEAPSKSEFVQMVLKATGVNGDMLAVDSGFTDDSDIPANLKGWVSYAAQKGYISGTKTDKGVFFYPNSPVTRAEAAVLINNILNAEGGKTLPYSDSDTIPSWAQEDVAALTELKVLGALSDGSFSPNENVTRAEAAKIVCRIVSPEK